MLAACCRTRHGRDGLPESVNLFMGVPSPDPDVLAGDPRIPEANNSGPAMQPRRPQPQLHLLGPEQRLDSTPPARAGYRGQPPHYLDHGGFDTL